MSQSEDKKDIKNTEVKEEQEETRLPVGELKWSKEQQEKEQQEKEQQEKEFTDKGKKEDKDTEENTAQKNNVHSEISATLLDVEKEQESSHISSHDEKDKKKDKKEDPLAGIEDTLTPIDFKTYEFDADQLKAIEQELNALNPQKLEEELHTIHQEQEHKHHPYNNFEDDVEDDVDDELEEDPSHSKLLKRTIWIVGVPALLVIVLFVSLIIGHTVIGGQPVGDIFDISMWMHVYNLIYS
jgi:hypothetical protein